jgi:alcohol dehydrogenase (cytochrome c)
MTALDSSDGTRLWEFQTGAGVNAPPTVFEYEGRQYVLVLAAGNLFARTSKGDSLWLFALDGTLEPVEAPRVAATPSSAVAEDHAGVPVPKAIPIPRVLSGSERRDAAALYGRTCAGCHGMSGEGSGNGIPLTNARAPSKSAEIIRDGRKEMPSFGDDLSPLEIGQIAVYISTLRQTAAKP